MSTRKSRIKVKISKSKLQGDSFYHTIEMAVDLGQNEHTIKDIKIYLLFSSFPILKIARPNAEFITFKDVKADRVLIIFPEIRKKPFERSIIARVTTFNPETKEEFSFHSNILTIPATKEN